MRRFWCRIVSYLLVAALSVAIFPPLAASVLVHTADNNLQSPQADELYNQGVILFNSAQFKESVSKMEAALPLYQASGSRIKEAFSLLYIGAGKRSLSDFYGAINSLQASLPIWQEARHFFLKGLTLTLIGEVYERQSKQEEAATAYKQAVEVVENLQTGIKIEKYQLPFNKLQGIAYERLIVLASLKGSFEEAFNYAERARARAFMNQFAYGNINFSRNADAELLAEGKVIEEKLAAARERLNNARNNTESQGQMRKEYKELDQDYEDWYLRLRVLSPEIASLKRVDVARLDEIQKAIAQIEPDTTIVEYFVTNRGTLAFIITPNSFKTLVLPVREQDIEKALNDWSDYDIKNLNHKENAHPESLQQLYKGLIVPIKSYVTTSNIGIIPHKQLHYVPFPGLTDGKRYLIDDYALFMLPNASILRFLPAKRKQSNGKILALGMGDPKLSGSSVDETLSVLTEVDKEVKSIPKIYPKTEVLVGQSATESIVLSKAGEHEILHIAAHAVYQPDNPLSSTIYLAKDMENDGNLQVRDLYKLDLKTATNLVVLTGCKVQKGTVNPGDEITSLSRGFMYAGSPSIIANLWRTPDDESTKVLIERFYTHLPKLSKAKALQQAQIEVRIQNPESAHPYYWAGFMLTGDWGQL